MILLYPNVFLFQFPLPHRVATRRLLWLTSLLPISSPPEKDNATYTRLFVSFPGCPVSSLSNCGLTFVTFGALPSHPPSFLFFYYFPGKPFVSLTVWRGNSRGYESRRNKSVKVVRLIVPFVVLEDTILSYRRNRFHEDNARNTQASRITGSVLEREREQQLFHQIFTRHRLRLPRGCTSPQ